MNWHQAFAASLTYEAFLDRYATPQQRARWRQVYEQVEITGAQRDLLGGFERETHVLVLAGAWCGDCIRQGPILQRIAEASPRITLRFLDRDDHPDVQDALVINAGRRVPVVVFCAEDDQECARVGDRSLAFYRQMARDHLGPACPTGIVAPDGDLLAAATDDWLREVERVQLMLRLSPRLRLRHHD